MPETRDTQKIGFTESDPALKELLERTNELADLSALAELASWDREALMPAGAVPARSNQLATISNIIHDRVTAPRLGELVAELAGRVSGGSFTDADRALVREVQRDYRRETQLPARLVRELSESVSHALEAWQAARKAKDFAGFAAPLGRVVAAQREAARLMAAELGSQTSYDALLDIYEPGLTTGDVTSMFEQIRGPLVALLGRIQASDEKPDTAALKGDYPTETQMALSRDILTRMGYDFTRGRIDTSAHPFMTSFGSPYDCRVCTRFDPEWIQEGLTSTIHEGGHALYELGIDPALSRTPLGSGTSMGIHESQSRLWENFLGRSPAFWHLHYAAVQAAFPALAQVPLELFVRALNVVKPSFIRVEADEITYNLHIIIRFELERDLMNGKIEVEALPKLWNDTYQQYLGITPPDDSLGVLQDIHWASGLFGYFPTYTLGTLYAAQLYRKLRHNFPDFDERLSKGETAFIREWLQTNLHRYGRIYRPAELIRQATGETLDPTAFITYIEDKYRKVYKLT